MSEAFVIPDFQLNSAIEEAVQDMLKDRDELPIHDIPHSFQELYKTSDMLDIVQSIKDYCYELIKTEVRQERARVESKNKDPTGYKISNSERRNLDHLARSMALKYGTFIIHNRSSRNTQEDQEFFETFMIFIMKVLSKAYVRNFLSVIEEELHRLFRSTAFNISYRKHVQEEKVRRYPQFKAAHRKDHDMVIRNIQFRNNVPPNRLKIDLSGSMNMRPGYVKLSPFRALNARSPLISMILPSPRDKIRQFELKRKHKRALNKSVVKYNESPVASVNRSFTKQCNLKATQL